MKIVSVKIPRSYLEDIDRLVREGYYTSRSEFIRTALRILLVKELNRLSTKKTTDNYFDEDEFVEDNYSFKRNSVKKNYLDI